MKKQIMVRAWEMYKTAGCTMKAEFAVALKMSWAEAKAPKNSIEEKLIEMGATLWEKGGHKRVYLNEVAEKIAGVTYTLYKSGSYSSIQVNGEHISNNKGGAFIACLNSVYYDVIQNKFYRNIATANGIGDMMMGFMDKICKLVA